MGTREQWEQYFKAILEGQEATAYEPQTGTGGAKDREEDKGAWAAHEICHPMVSTMLEGLALLSRCNRHDYAV